ncbi:LysM peptidoglycan-binding domain-containing protein [Bacillus sp. FJAT-45350]|uniref:LysM peptidoglycan-binding domain-containing protein n=1 Tax=Bacillus sp. FJAT-45350 TaxID=2011014 RepID=UPI0015C7FB1D|nr:LysM domain-containing protein [Bacillus sp. FJAT-45350]
MKKATRIITPILGVGLVFGAIGVSASETVTVERGDTYWGLAQGYNNVSVEELIGANDYHPNELQTGVELTIPTNEDTTSNDEVVTHVIQPGNTLAEIAEAYDGVTVDELIRLNPGINPYELTVGSEILVATNGNEHGEDYVYHTVQPGNTYYEIANAYDGVSVDDLREANPNIDPYELPIGYQIIIPIN